MRQETPTAETIFTESSQNLHRICFVYSVNSFLFYGLVSHSLAVRAEAARFCDHVDIFVFNFAGEEKECGDPAKLRKFL